VGVGVGVCGCVSARASMVCRRGYFGVDYCTYLRYLFLFFFYLFVISILSAFYLLNEGFKSS